MCGLGRDNIQKRLLTESDLTFVKAVEIAVSMEIANRDTLELQSNRGIWGAVSGTKLTTAVLKRRHATNVSAEATLKQHAKIKGKQRKIKNQCTQ